MLTLRKNENNDEHNRYFFLWVRKSFRPWSLLQPFLSCSTCMIGTEKPAEFHCMKGPQFQTCQLFPSHSRHVYGYDCLAIFNVFHCKCVYVFMPCQKTTHLFASAAFVTASVKNSIKDFQPCAPFFGFNQHTPPRLSRLVHQKGHISVCMARAGPSRQRVIQ